MLKTALSQYGVKEIVGEEDNQTIVNYAKEAGFSWVDNDETPWCSIFMNWVALRAGYERSDKANARSWLNVGEKVESPVTGDVVVFKRGNSSWQGHIGIFVRTDGDLVYVLGGNQSNMVNIKPYNKNKVLGYRRLKKIEK